MFYIKACPFCGDGALGIRRCADGHKLVVMCDECESVWTSPDNISLTNILDIEDNGFKLRDLELEIGGGSAGWASEAEIAAKGWSQFVVGVQPE